MDKKIITGVMGLSVFIAAIMTGMVVYDDTTYYCEDNDQICIGTRLSSTGKTCYYIDTDGDERGKRCLIEPYWQKYKNQDIILKDITREMYICHPEPLGCILY